MELSKKQLWKAMHQPTYHHCDTCVGSSLQCQFTRICASSHKTWVRESAINNPHIEDLWTWNETK